MTTCTYFWFFKNSCFKIPLYGLTIGSLTVLDFCLKIMYTCSLWIYPGLTISISPSLGDKIIECLSLIDALMLDGYFRDTANIRHYWPLTLVEISFSLDLERKKQLSVREWHGSSSPCFFVFILWHMLTIHRGFIGIFPYMHILNFDQNYSHYYCVLTHLLHSRLF
jgi:hypothetical protein